MTIASTYLPNGLGELTGDELVITEPWYTDGVVRYFDSTNGDDTNTGLERLQPLKTLQTYLNGIAPAARDILVLADGFSELLDDDIGLFEGTVIVGAGKTADGGPTCRLSSNSAVDSIFDVSVANVEFRNIIFDRVLLNSTTPIISVTGGDNALIRDCRFEMGNLDGYAAVEFSGGDFHAITGTIFLVTDTSGTRPQEGLRCVVDVAGLLLEDVTFDGGTLGFEGGIGADLTGVAKTFLRIESLDLLLGADMRLTEASDGRIQDLSDVTGAGRLVFV